MNINIINGNGEYVRNGINDLYEYAIKYYGDKYEKNILDTISEVQFYEWEDNQTESDVIFDITDGKYDDPNDEDLVYETAGFYYLNVKDKNTCDKIVAFRNKYLKDNYHFLVHELFGHGVFSNVDAVLNYDEDMTMKRNGISIMVEEEDIICYEYLNEGFVEDAVLNIMQKAGLRPLWLEQYFYARQAASIIRRHVGHENLYDSLILNEGCVENMYNIDEKNDSFFKLDLLLSLYYEYGSSPKLNSLYNKNLRNFIKRRKRCK